MKQSILAWANIFFLPFGPRIIDLDTAFIDLNYAGFRVPYSEWLEYTYEMLRNCVDRIKETQAAEKRELDKVKNKNR